MTAIKPKDFDLLTHNGTHLFWRLNILESECTVSSEGIHTASENHDIIRFYKNAIIFEPFGSENCDVIKHTVAYVKRLGNVGIYAPKGIYGKLL